jgi:hypothetical protein
VAGQASRTAPRRSAPDINRARASKIDQLRQRLIAGRNADGGWGYYADHASRLEPTCWAMLALHAAGAPRAQLDSAAAWLAQCERTPGWLVENPAWPINIAFNALAVFTLRDRPGPPADAIVPRVKASLIASKGVAAPQSPDAPQDNSLQGWSWIDATFSWVEPTCWGVLALKSTRAPGARDPKTDTAIGSRLAEAERLLTDRSCRPGGWNFGNAVVMRQDLRPYVPVTALALLAMQDLRGADVVNRGLAALETLWPTELSATALGLSLICLDVYDRPANQLVTQLTEHVDKALEFGNYHGMAVALFALSSAGHAHAFKL